MPTWPKDFAWSYHGPVGSECLNIRENGSMATLWHDNYLCWSKGEYSLGIKWSSTGVYAVYSF